MPFLIVSCVRLLDLPQLAVPQGGVGTVVENYVRHEDRQPLVAFAVPRQPPSLMLLFVIRVSSYGFVVCTSVYVLCAVWCFADHEVENGVTKPRSGLHFRSRIFESLEIDLNFLKDDIFFLVRILYSYII